jgi:hypothetical protein
MVRIKGPVVRLAYARCKHKKNPELLHPGLPHYHDRNSFSRKHVGVLYLLVKIHKKPSKVRDKEGKNKYYRNGSCQIKVFCWTLRSKVRHEVRWVYPVDIGAKPKKAWFDFWLTLLFIAFCQLVLISPSLCVLPQVPNLPYTSEAACFPADS